MPHLGKRNAKEKKRIYFNESVFDEPALAKFVDVYPQIYAKKNMRQNKQVQAPNPAATTLPTPTKHLSKPTNVPYSKQMHQCRKSSQCAAQSMCARFRVRGRWAICALCVFLMRFPDAFS